MEDDHPASEMIRLAVAATRALWPRVPPLGMVTFVDPTEVAATPMRRHRCRINCGERRIYGYSYERAGFAHVGYTAERGLWAWQLLPDDMPEPSAPLFMQHLITFDNVAAHANA